MSMMVLVISCYKNKDVTNTPTNSQITISSSGFSPASLTVVMGSTVTWVNNDNVMHTVTTDDGSINSGDIAAGTSYSKTFSAAGTYSYHDTHNTSMLGVVIVTKDSGGGGGY